MERPWRIVGPRGRPSNGLMWMSRIVRARSGPATGTCATTAIIISGRCRGRRRWSTASCAVRRPRARVGGAPSAPKPNGPAACRAGVWAGRCCAGSAIAALPAMGRYPSCGQHERTRTRSGGPTMPSHTIVACTKQCWRPGSKTLHGSLRPTGIASRWYSRSMDDNRKRAMRRCLWYASSRGSGSGLPSPGSQVRRRQSAG